MPAVARSATGSKCDGFLEYRACQLQRLVLRLARHEDAYDISTNIDVLQAIISFLLRETELTADFIIKDNGPISRPGHNPVL